MIPRFPAWALGRKRVAPFLNKENMKLSMTYGKCNYLW